MEPPYVFVNTRPASWLKTDVPTLTTVTGTVTLAPFAVSRMVPLKYSFGDQTGIR